MRLPDSAEHEDGDPAVAAVGENSANGIVKQAIQESDGLVPNDDRPQAIAISQSISQTLSYSGPLPSPEAMAGYGSIHKSFPERIMKMAEKEQDWRHSMEISAVSAVKSDFSLKKRGQVLGFMVLPILVGFGAYLAHLGDTKSAAWFGVVGIFSIVGLFITGQYFDRKVTEDLDDEE